MSCRETLRCAQSYRKANGNTKEVWEKLIAENKLGYMAILRNLRNILNAQPENIGEVYDKLADKEQVLKSKQLPFRFFSAYREIQGQPNCTSKVLDILETAIEHSVGNLPKLGGKTVIAIDTSGSMGSSISNKSTVKCEDIARLLGVLASKICDEYIVFTFDTNLRQVTFSTKDSIISTALRIPVQGGGTDLTLPLGYMLENTIKADRLIMLSDNEINSGWDSAYYRWGYGRYNASTCQNFADKYRETINKDLWVHAIDLQGYGTQQFIGGKTNIIAGWSERVLEFISLSEQGIDTQVKRIAEYA